MHNLPPDGPFIVSELLWFAVNDFSKLPERIRQLFDSGCIDFRPSSLVFTTKEGVKYVLSGKDLLLFRGDEPYTLVHLN